MLYLYDNAIVEDLEKSFNRDSVEDPVVRVVGPDGIIALSAQLHKDKIKFPVVALTRDPDTPIDTKRTNFTMMHKGVSCVFDNETNTYYNEKAVPIELGYELAVLTTNTADADELIRELTFKYTMMYFLTIRLPYESDRKLRFGITVDLDNPIERNSGSLEYSQTGSVYQTTLHLKCEGCVMLHYTPVKLNRQEYGINPVNPKH